MKDQACDFAGSIPLRLEPKMLLDLDCKDPKLSLRMVLLLNTALSYANDASVSTWGRAFSCPSTSFAPPWKEKLLRFYPLTGSLSLSTHGSILMSGIGWCLGCPLFGHTAFASPETGSTRSSAGSIPSPRG
jgi:hypothetical protein